MNEKATSKPIKYGSMNLHLTDLDLIVCWKQQTFSASLKTNHIFFAHTTPPMLKTFSTAGHSSPISPLNWEFTE